MGSTFFIVASVLKIGAAMAAGLGASSAFQYFHNFNFKPSKKEGGISDDNGIKSLREKARQIS